MTELNGIPRVANISLTHSSPARSNHHEKLVLFKMINCFSSFHYFQINPNVQTTLLSPISPVSSPETVDVLQSAERLVKNAQKQIMEVSFNTALNTLDEYPSK